MSEFNEGDLVEAVKGETRMTARLEWDGYLRFPGWYGVDDLFRNGWVLTRIEKAAPKLPSEPGIYQARDGVTWRRAHGGVLYRLYDGSEDAERYAPFTKLEPVAVTAKRVAEFAREWIDAGDTYRIESFHAAIAEEFGVPNE